MSAAERLRRLGRGLLERLGLSRQTVLRRSNSSAGAVQPKPYRLLPPEHHSLRECRAADRANAELYERRCAAVRALPPSMQARQPAPPPEPNNADRFVRYHEDHTPVNASLQARAVIALYHSGRRLDQDYRPAEAIALARAVPRPTDVEEAMLEARRAAAAGLCFCIYSDEELLRMSKRDCRRADRSNERLLMRVERGRRRLRSQTAGLVDVSQSNLTPAVQSNFQRRVQLKQRNVLVSARRQAEAVEFLTGAGLVLLQDYEPQNAVVEAARLRSQGTTPVTTLARDSSNDASTDAAPLPAAPPAASLDGLTPELLRALQLASCLYPAQAAPVAAATDQPAAVPPAAAAVPSCPSDTAAVPAYTPTTPTNPYAHNPYAPVSVPVAQGYKPAGPRR